MKNKGHPNVWSVEVIIYHQRYRNYLRKGNIISVNERKKQDFIKGTDYESVETYLKKKRNALVIHILLLSGIFMSI